MQVEILGKKNRTLKTVTHNGQCFVEAPQSGSYIIRLRNTSACRRKAVVSVDGVNVLDGKDAGIDGQGYVLNGLETIDIPGWRRSDSSVAKFQFTEQGGSYSAQTGRGTSNVGVIGVAVFDEKVQTFVPSWIYTTILPAPVVSPYPWNSGILYGSNNASDGRRMRSMSLGKMGSDSTVQCNAGAARGMKSMEDNDSLGIGDVEEKTSGGLFSANYVSNAAPVDVGTGYGQEAKFHTTSVIFHQATTTPALVISLRYATRERLLSWGVPIDTVQSAPKAPNPFPASYPSVPAPPGWQG